MFLQISHEIKYFMTNDIYSYVYFSMSFISSSASIGFTTENSFINGQWPFARN